MRVELITDIDVDDEIAFIEDLPFEYEGIFSIDDENEKNIDWIRVNNAQFTGSLVIINGTHTHTDWTTIYRVADHTRVIVYEE